MVERFGDFEKGGLSDLELELGIEGGGIGIDLAVTALYIKPTHQ